MKRIAALFLAFVVFTAACTQQKAALKAGYKSSKEKIFPADKDTAFSRQSSVPVMALPPRKLGYLHTLGLVWGFLKYHHPAIAEGRYNWDNELFRFLPQYIAAVEDTPGRNAMLYAWIKALGPFETAPLSPPQSPRGGEAFSKLLPDWGWIDSAGFSPQLRAALLQIKNAKRPRENYYVRLAEGSKTPVFLHERAYEKASFPDAGRQLLCLYRYWNAVQYFYPYKNEWGEDWKSVLAQMIPRFIRAQNEEAYRSAVQDLERKIRAVGKDVALERALESLYTGK